MLSRFRSSLKPLQSFLARLFIVLHIPANEVSLSGLLFALIGAAFVVQHLWLGALVFFVLAPLMDLIDGEVARAQKARSYWGNYFETMIDKYVDFAMLGSFAFVPGLAVPAVLALGFSLIASYAKPRAALIIISDNRDWPGIGEHGDKIALVLVGLFFRVLGYNFLALALYAVALISAIGAVQRMEYARHLIREAERKGTILPYLKKKRER